jgi:hypothetical protein
MRRKKVAGRNVAIKTTGKIERVRDVPLCRWCGKKLRPLYESKLEEVRRTYEFEKEADARAIDGAQVSYNEKKKKWIVTTVHRRAARRKWLGKFGKDGNNFFCSDGCARHYALAVANATTNGEVRLLDATGQAVTFRQGAA